MTTQTLHGSCHCGRVKYEARIDLARGTTKCNCTYCLKARNWSAMLKAADFTLLSGKDELTAYAGRNPSATQYFCRTCGVLTHGAGTLEALGGAFVSVKVNTLDDVEPRALVEGPMQLCNGRDNAWWTPPDFTAHL